MIITPWRHRRDRGGIVIDMGVHYADILEYYLGPIDAVAGMAAVVDAERIDPQGARHPADAEDLSVGVMRFRSGAIANWLLRSPDAARPVCPHRLRHRRLALYSRRPLGQAPNALAAPRRRGCAGAVRRIASAWCPILRLDATTAALFGGERLARYDLPWTDIDASLLAIEQADFVDAIANRPRARGQR